MHGLGVSTRRLRSFDAHELTMDRAIVTWINSQQASYKIPELGGKVSWQRVVVSTHDLEDQGGQGGRLEGAFEGAHLVEDAAEGPDVRLVVVGFALAELGGDVTWGTC